MTKEELEVRINDLFEKFRGNVGLFAQKKLSNETIEVGADEWFPSASLIKIPIMIGVFNAIENGDLSLDQRCFYHHQYNYPYEKDMINQVRDGAEFTIETLLHLMISLSDNTASQWLQELCGGGKKINEWLSAHGYPVTKVNKWTPDRENDYRIWGWGTTTPREMARLVQELRTSHSFLPGYSLKMCSYLKRSAWDGEALSALPLSTAHLSKQGAINDAKSEVVTVFGKQGEYTFCIATKNQLDQGYESHNEGYVLIRKVSALLYSYFEQEPSS